MTKKILIIDDIEDNLITLEAILEDAFSDCSICTALDGRAGLEKAAECLPDVILLDILMPGMDGFTVCRQLKKDDVLRDIPVVILTALQETKENRLTALEAGAEAFISKPVDIIELTAQIRAMLKIREANIDKKNEKERLERLVEERTSELEKSRQSMMNTLGDLRETELLLRTVMENLPVGIAVNSVGENVQFEYMNDNFCKNYRLTKEKLQTAGFWDAVYSNSEFRRQMKQRVLDDCAAADPEKMQWSDIPIERDGEDTTYVNARNIPVPGKKLMISTVWDVTDHIKAERDGIKSLETMRSLLNSIIQAMSVTVETRDPYTAGHQRRVAELARAIAQHMQLDENTVQGLFMAAQIHDLGKISIPAELLSMPRKLTAIEFGLIKTHSQAGHDILKDIAFPWPIARIILEHHEKNDGSGYPRGLTGKEILIESQILTVADVVEAIASHRPYRPAMGIKTALDEIIRHCGTFFAPEVVSSCLALFNEQQFAFSS